MNKEEIRHFCAFCFATDVDGSWDHTTIPEANHCTNCGAGGTLVTIPQWAVEAIRKNGSWVCKRYYPAEEDKENLEERRRLLKLVKTFPGRTVKKIPYKNARILPDDPGWFWAIDQDTGKGRMTSVTLAANEAATKEEALEKSRYILPYYEKAQ